MSKSKKREAQKLLNGMHQRINRFAARSDNQSDYLQKIEDHTVTLVIGPAGTGKTFLAIVAAAKALKNGDVGKIVLTRPAVESCGERLGALPGDAAEKIDPYMIPLYESLEKVIGRQQCRDLLSKGIIDVVPLAYMRGRTLDNAFVIMDEAQNSAVEQVKMLMTRLGFGSKLVVTGDLEQSDISNHYDERKNRRRSGLEDAVLRFYDDCNDIAVAVLTEEDIQRHPLIKHIIRKYRGKLPEGIRIDEIFTELFEDF